MANDYYIPTEADLEEYQRYLDDQEAEHGYWWQQYEEDHEYFSRVADSYPRNNHWQQSVRQLQKMENWKYGI